MSVSSLDPTTVAVLEYFLKNREGDYVSSVSAALGINQRIVSTTLRNFEKREFFSHEWDEAEIRGKSGYRKRYVVKPEKIDAIIGLIKYLKS